MTSLSAGKGNSKYKNGIKKSKNQKEEKKGTRPLSIYPHSTHSFDNTNDDENNNNNNNNNNR